MQPANRKNLIGNANQSNSIFEADFTKGGFNPFQQKTNKGHREMFDDSINISEIKHTNDSPNCSQLGPIEIKADDSAANLSASDAGDKKAATGRQRGAPRRERKANTQSEAMSDILKEASMIKEHWKETLNVGGVAVQEKADPNMTETKDSENISQSSPDLNQSKGNTENPESPDLKPMEANFSKKPKQTAMDADLKMVKSQASKDDEKLAESPINASPEQIKREKPEEPLEYTDKPAEIVENSNLKNHDDLKDEKESIETPFEIIEVANARKDDKDEESISRSDDEDQE